MNELLYEELLNYAKSIGKFKEMVSSESKRPIAVRTLMYVANINKQMAWDFVTEYYDRMDLKFGGVRLSNEMQVRNDNNFNMKHK
jgi:hypothetical protein